MSSPFIGFCLCDPDDTNAIHFTCFFQVHSEPIDFKTHNSELLAQAHEIRNLIKQRKSSLYC